MPQVACDSCYRKKERCHFGLGTKRCRQCVHQGQPCSFVRPRQRMGRPPSAMAVPYGSCNVMVFDANERQLLPQSLKPSITSQSSNVSSGEVLSTMGPLSFATRPNLFRQTRYDQVKHILSDQNKFFNLHCHFMIGPSFIVRFQTAVQTVIGHSHGVLLDAYSAVLVLWDSEHNRAKIPVAFNLDEGIWCLKKLQAASIIRTEDAATVVLLGQILVVYHAAVMCTSAHAIVRNSLFLIESWYPALLSEPRLNPITLTSIFVDTVECLVRREIPVLRIPYANDCIVDRYVGLCFGLLPILYDLCDLSHRAKKLPAVTMAGIPEKDLGAEEDLFTQIERRVRQWEPVLPLNLFDEYSAFEVSAMLLQARVYRIATFLIIHRLRYALGVKDDTASKLANAIAVELMDFAKGAPGHIRGLPIILPLFLTMLEVKGPGEEIMHELAPFSIYPQYSERLRAFVKLARDARDDGFCGLWFDLVEGELHLPIIP